MGTLPGLDTARAVDGVHEAIREGAAPPTPFVGRAERIRLRPPLAMTAPIAVRWSPIAARTAGGTNALNRGPVTPANSPPSPTIAHAAMLLGLVLMALSLVALDRVTSIAYSTPLLALAAASWTLPAVNAYPLFVEPVPRSARGVLGAMFLLCMALGGAVGDPLNGGLFDLCAGYRPLFATMAAYTGLACVAVLCVPKGAGEADTGSLSRGLDRVV